MLGFGEIRFLENPSKFGDARHLRALGDCQPCVSPVVKLEEVNRLRKKMLLLTGENEIEESRNGFLLVERQPHADHRSPP